jgi:hypothetical protein
VLQQSLSMKDLSDEEQRNLVIPNAGLWNLFNPPVGGILICVKTPLTGTALKA